MAAPTPARGISFHVTIIVAPENASKFLESSRQVFKDIAAEPKCLYFSLVESAEQKGKFKIVENWAMSFGEFQKEQMTKPYYKPYEEATKPLWLEERTGELFELLPAEWTHQKEENVK